MYSIGEIGKITNLTSRTLRHYEDKGLIRPSRRSQNGYRYFSIKSISIIERIKKYKMMEFSLDEIRSLLDLEDKKIEVGIQDRLLCKLKAVDKELKRLNSSKEEIHTQLLATNSFFQGKVLEKGHRRVLMETIKSEILSRLKEKRKVEVRDLEYLKREEYLYDSDEKREFFEALSMCIKFAKDEGIKLGPARGAAPASLSLYALGWGKFDPINFNLIPERYSQHNLDLHIDVEFKNGKKFINYCRKVSADLRVGCIEAFRLPIIDIIDNVHTRLGKIPDYDLIDNDNPVVLDIFRRGDIEKIFSFDIPPETLCAKHMERYYQKDSALEGLREYIKSQEVYSFIDLLNIGALYRPMNKNSFINEYIDRYPIAKKNGFYYDCLSSTLNEYLKPNYGVIIYQEDILKIINEYTSWNYMKCNEFRLKIVRGKTSEEDKKEFLEYVDSDILNLVLKETPVTFCKAHAFGAWPRLIKTTAVLKTLHKDIYFEEINKWEEKNDYSWGDFGFISGGVSLLQQ